MIEKIDADINNNSVLQLEGPILVLGASGFVGANLFHFLNQFRNDVFAGVPQDKGWRLREIDDSKIVKIDIENSNSIDESLKRINPKTIFNFIAYGAYSFEEDQNKIYKTNLEATINLINILNELNISAFIHAGSSSEYGLNSNKPLENAECIPNSDYSISKLAITNYINMMGKKFNFPGISLRLYSVYGPLEDESRLMPNLVKLALERKFPSFVNKEVSRDFVYISDVCNAFVTAALKINKDLYGETFNIGSGNKTTIEDLAIISKKLFKIEKDPEFGNMQERKWDLTDWYSNPAKANEILEWKASIPIEEGLKKISEWMKSNKYNRKVKKTKENLEKPTKKISAIIACYKDEKSIPIMYKELSSVFKKLKIEYEIIFVNDCSPDQSKELILKISKNDPRVVGINHSRNFGSQMAFVSGMEIAKGDSVVLLDGDLQDPPKIIEKFYEKWEEGYDVVYGVRAKREMKRIVEFQYKMFYKVFSKFSYLDIPRDAGDFSLLDKKVVKVILNFQEKDLFLRGIRAYVGFNQVGVEYFRPERRFGKSTNNFFKNIDWAKKGIFSFSNSPLAFLTASGFILLIISFILIMTFIILRIIYPDIAPEGATTILVSIFTFGALNILAIGIVGEYIGKILIEVKQRPRLIRESIIRNGIIKNEKNIS